MRTGFIRWIKTAFSLALLALAVSATAQTIVTNNLQVNAPKALDNRTGKFSAGAWVPYVSTTEANTAIISSRRYVGLTVCIGTPTVFSEYWYYGGIADGNLVIKNAGGGSGSVTSVALTMPSAFSVANSPVTSTGTLAVTATGNSSTQYINGAGGLSLVSNLPVSTATQTALDAKATINALADSMHRVLGYWNVEAFGAVPISLVNPDAAPASDSAIQACILYAWSHDSTGNPVIYLPGMYRLNSNPSRMINGVQHYCQLYVPLTPYDQTTTFKKIDFVGKSSGNFGGFGPNTNLYSGSGFYCSWIDSTVHGIVLGTEHATAVGTFQNVNYTTCEVRNIKIVIKTHRGASEVANYMSGIDFDDLNSVLIDNVQVRCSSDITAMIAPGTGSIGIRMPRLNNHARLYANRIEIFGLDYGVIFGEHCDANLCIVAYCNRGIKVRGTYPVTISQLCTEGNIVNIEGEGGSQTNIGAFQEENYTGGWNSFQYSLYALSAPSTFHVTVGQHIAHGFGGGSSPIVKSDPTIDLKMASDAQGVNQIPTNLFTTSTRPSSMVSYGGWGINTDSNKIQYYTASGWVTLGTTVAGVTPHNILRDSFNRANSAITAGNLDSPSVAWTPVVGTWGISSNTLYCVNEAGSSGGAVFNLEVVDAGVSDFTYHAKVNKGTPSEGGLVFRYVDANNYLFLDVSGGGTGLYKMVSGTVTQIGSTVAGVASSYDFVVTTSGTSVTVYKNGTSIISNTVTNFTSATKIGAFVVSGTGFGGGIAIDDVTVKVP